jgi:hypothetical protein
MVRGSDVDVKTYNVAMTACELSSQWQRGLMLMKDRAQATWKLKLPNKAWDFAMG